MFSISKVITIKSFIKILSNIAYFIINSFLLILIFLFLTTDLDDKLHIKGLNYLIDKNLVGYDTSITKNYKSIFFDHNISKSEKDNIENALEKVNYLHDEFIVNNLKIVITKKSIKDTVDLVGGRLINTDLSHSQDTSGIYFPDFKLIIVTLYNLDNLYNLLIEDENIKSSNISIDNLLEQADILNASVLFHEIGHFLDDINNQELHTNAEFKSIYKKEKNLIFDNSQSYYKSDISEYIAECISYILSSEVVDINENESFFTSSTYKVLTDYINTFKN